MKNKILTQLRLFATRLMTWIGSAWAKTESLRAKIAERYRQSRLSHYVAQAGAWCQKTRLYMWLQKKWAPVVSQYHYLRGQFDRLSEPVSDDLIQSMKLQGENIDLDDEGDIGRGSTLFVLIGSFFVIALLWATFAELDEVVRAEGTIVPPSAVQTVQSRLPGSVTEINIKLGDRVTRGDILFQIEDGDALANFDDNEIRLINSGAAVARLEAEAAGDDDVTFSPEMMTTNPVAVANERRLFVQRQTALKDRLRIIERSVAEKEAEMRAAKASVDNLTEEIKILEPLVADGHESKLQLLQRKSELAQRQGAYDLAKLAITRGRDEYNSVVSNFRAEAAVELAEFRQKSEQAQAMKDALRGKVEHTAIRSPVTGTVSAVMVKTVGGVVQPGTLMAEIVPDAQAILVRAQVQPKDISGIFPDQPASVSLASYDTARYGTLKGRVLRIASNTTQEDGKPPYYETIIEVPEPRFSKSPEDVETVPGMMATVNMIGRKRSILNYILTPLERAAGVAFREK